MFPNPKGIAPQIKNSVNVDYFAFHLIIDAKRKSLRMESKVETMNTGKEY